MEEWKVENDTRHESLACPSGFKRRRISPSMPANSLSLGARESCSSLKERFESSQRYSGLNSVQPESPSSGSSGAIEDPQSQLKVSNLVEQPSSTVEDIFCYGMATVAQCEYPQRRIIQTTHQFSARLMSSNSFMLLDAGETTEGKIPSSFKEMLGRLLDLPALQLQVLCNFNSLNSNPISRFAKNSAEWISCSLNIIVYGPDRWLDWTGEFFEEYGIHLQRPYGCDRNVPYRNPQTFASQDPPPYPMTFELGNMQAPCHLQSMPDQANILDEFTTEEELQEAHQPQAIRTRLERHQKQALTFLFRRECGWIMDESVCDIWRYQSSHPRPFINMVSGNRQVEEPMDFRGGILADPMGLGKTLTMISLVASDLEPANVRNESVQLTLVILPPALLTTWEQQLEEHLVLGKLLCYRHHGRSKISSNYDFFSPGVVLTTYHTVSVEWKKRSSAQPSLLLATHWRRIILDEAHIIRNPGSQITKAICSLNATSRWAMTGTPIQNRLTDLSTLLKFLRVDPYHKLEVFESDIAVLWKRGDAKEALDRLKRLLQCLLLRRSKGTVQLPARTDLKCALEFRPEERKLYETVHQIAVQRVKEALLRGAGSSKSYLNALQQIDALRRICNLGCFYTSTSSRSRGSSHSKDWRLTAQQSFNYLLEFEDTVCHFCSMSLDILQQSTIDQQSPGVRIFSCLRIICPTCTQKALSEAMEQCGHMPPCQSAFVQPGDIDEKLEFSPSTSSHQQLPTKVQALLSQLKAGASAKSLVFSFWTTTLDVIERGLNESNITFVRFDGSTSQKKREEALETFRNDSAVQVILLTMSCGAAGLNLTVASRVYLMEPHWNPTVEEQAMSRVHRIGQTREVTTVRFFIRDSFEEHVMDIQKSKREFADMILSTSNSQSDVSLQRLEYLRSLL